MHTLHREFASQAQIDAQYDPAVTASDGPAHLRRFIEQSRLTRETLPCVLDVPYGATLDETLDIFPAARANAPLLMFLHGGYWRAFSSKDFSCVALGLQPLGITTVVVNYSLCPKVGLDEITRQVRAAVAWTLRHIGEYGGNPSRVAVGGHSAGAHLGAMCLATPWSEAYGLPPDPLACAVLISGVYDIAPLRYSYLQPLIQLDDGVIRRNSPLHAIRSCPTPALITWGGVESQEFARQSREFQAGWQAAGNRSELVMQTGANHFSVMQGLEDSGSSMCRWIADALA